ncbi:DUF3606 domain-containing protein [Schlegelella sp. S2-27]|uniref:DUF3606 domain-containing protein n=1 Tax=Caldimonas mangrovi TaxID=2944811 RepID=A0ABT0YYC2_9BURK|nr:DUF3606 domain-containing protein [Caldimonas mangrovi]MCM5682833.1 DUF3606 domain-containing protein [Caldimonas mangrovi]
MERRHGREPAKRRGASGPGLWLDEKESHAPAPVDMGEESVAGEEDPGASMDTAMATGNTRPGGTDPGSGLPGPAAAEAGAADADDELRGFEPLDRGRIHLLDPLEVKFWCRELNCSAPELKDTVTKVGTHTAAVREALHKKKPS